MKTKTVIACFIAGALSLPIVGYTADGDSGRTSPKMYVKDSAITIKIKAEIATKMTYKDQVHVDTDHNGAVFLSGTVISQADADQVVAIAKGVKGVTSVENKIVVKRAL